MKKSIAMSFVAMLVVLGSVAAPTAFADPDHSGGAATSDPDDNGRGPDRSNGGADKPGSSGGVDQTDKDGNNGCGNDADREDDSEGGAGTTQRGAETAVEGPTDPTDPASVAS